MSRDGKCSAGISKPRPAQYLFQLTKPCIIYTRAGSFLLTGLAKYGSPACSISSGQTSPADRSQTCFSWEF